MGESFDYSKSLLDIEGESYHYMVNSMFEIYEYNDCIYVMLSFLDNVDGVEEGDTVEIVEIMEKPEEVVEETRGEDEGVILLSGVGFCIPRKEGSRWKIRTDRGVDLLHLMYSGWNDSFLLIGGEVVDDVDKREFKISKLENKVHKLEERVEELEDSVE